MTRKHRVLIVEDEMITSMEIRDRMEQMGCEIVGEVVSGEESIRVAEEAQPDVVLMDIRLKGEMDGVEAARVIRERWDIPVIFLSAYSDEQTLQMAKATDPYIYLLKPFSDRGLYTAIDFAVYRHRVEQGLKKREQRLSRILDTLEGDVIVLDEEARIVFLNRNASRVIGQDRETILGRDFSRVIEFVGIKKRENPLTRVLSSGESVDLAGCAIQCQKRDGKTKIRGKALPLLDDDGNLTGAVMVFRGLSS